MKRVVASLLVVCAVVVGLLTACNHNSGDSSLDVSLVNLGQATNGGGLGEVAFLCTLRLQNASPDALQVSGGAYKVYLNGIYAGEGLTHESVAVPALGTTTVNVPVYLSTFRLAASFYRMYETHKADYRLTSTVYALLDGHRKVLRTERSGSVDFDSLGNPPPTNAPPAAAGRP